MLRTLTEDSDFDGQVVFLRVDANVPLDAGVITDDGRIKAFLPTLEWLLNKARLSSWRAIWDALAVQKTPV